MSQAGPRSCGLGGGGIWQTSWVLREERCPQRYWHFNQKGLPLGPPVCRQKGRATVHWIHASIETWTSLTYNLAAVVLKELVENFQFKAHAVFYLFYCIWEMLVMLLCFLGPAYGFWPSLIMPSKYLLWSISGRSHSGLGITGIILLYLWTLPLLLRSLPEDCNG